MKKISYAAQPDEGMSELRLITRSLMLLAFVTGILYIRVFLVETLAALDVGGQGWVGMFSFLFLVTAIIGLILTWRWEALGSVIVLGSGAGLAVLSFLTAVEAPWLSAVFYGSPFIITGSLTLVCWWRGRSGRK